MMMLLMMEISKMVDTATYYINLPSPFINFFKMAATHPSSTIWPYQPLKMPQNAPFSYY